MVGAPSRASTGKGTGALVFSDLIAHCHGPWAIVPERLAVMLQALNGFDAAAVEAARAARDARPPRQQAAVAVLSVSGPLEARPNVLSWLFGTLSYEEIAASLSDAVADPAIKGVILDINSPGGTVYGLPELAKTIRSLRGTKPIVASANAEAASAAYYIASQADELVVTPSGAVGSIGTVFVHADMSGMAEQAGVKFTIVRSPDRKVEGNSMEPLSDAALADIQSKVDAYTAMFQRDVARGRGVTAEKVSADFGQGRMLLAKDALAAGLVDRIEPIDATIQRVMRGEVAARQAGPDAVDADGTEAEPPVPAVRIEAIDADERMRRSARLIDIALAGRR